MRDGEDASVPSRSDWAAAGLGPLITLKNPDALSNS